MTSEGVIRVVAHALQSSSNKESSTTAAAAYTVLASLLCRDVACADRHSCHCGYLRLVCAALREFPDSVEVQSAACKALCSVVPPEALLVKEHHHNDTAVASVVAAMARHPHAAAVQASGCALLKQCINYSDGVIAVAELGGVMAALCAAATHGAHARVQGCALGVLGCRNTCALYTSSDAEVLVPLTLRAMAAHPRAYSVQKEGCTLLANLCFTLVPGCAVRAYAEGCLMAVLRALETRGEAVKVARHACIVMHNLLFIDAVEPDSAALVLERTVSAMASHVGDVTLLRIACKTITRLCAVLDVWSDTCWLACAVIHAACTCYKTDAKVQRDAQSALRRLTDFAQRHRKETSFLRWAFQIQA